MSEFTELQTQLAALGFWPGGPRPGVVNACRIDREVCARAICEVCGWKGLIYKPFVNHAGTYRAYSCCPHCGDCSEF
ncbi:hypothetical protein ES703_51944 [subsurface metagenome]